MIVDEYGQVLFTEDELADLLYTNPTVELSKFSILDGSYLDREYFDDNLKFSCKFDASVEKTYADFGKSKKIVEPTNIHEYHSNFQEKWFMPEEYYNMDIAKWVLDQCKTQEELQRVGEELILYQERNLFFLLKQLKYIVDTWKKNNIIWGVGRGSSVSSYVLYLIGVHKINSMYYDLDINEFLR